MKRRWKATAILPFGFSSTVPAGLAWSPPSRAEAEEERLYWQRRAIADRARAVADFGRGMVVRVNEREVKRALLEGELACLNALESVDQKTATAIGIAQARAQTWSLEEHQAMLEKRRILEGEVFFAKPRRPDRAEVDRAAAFFTANTVAPTGQLTREAFERALKGYGRSHGIIRGVTGF